MGKLTVEVLKWAVLGPRAWVSRPRIWVQRTCLEPGFRGTSLVLAPLEWVWSLGLHGQTQNQGLHKGRPGTGAWVQPGSEG